MNSLPRVWVPYLFCSYLALQYERYESDMVWERKDYLIFLFENDSSDPVPYSDRRYQRPLCSLGHILSFWMAMKGEAGMRFLSDIQYVREYPRWWIHLSLLGWRKLQMMNSSSVTEKGVLSWITDRDRNRPTLIHRAAVSNGRQTHSNHRRFSFRKNLVFGPAGRYKYIIDKI